MVVICQLTTEEIIEIWFYHVHDVCICVTVVNLFKTKQTKAECLFPLIIQFRFII